MAKQTLNNSETGLSIRTKINENFTEVYAGIATESSTSLRIGTGSTFTGTTRNTVIGQSSQGGSQDNVVIGYNNKMAATASFSTLIGNNLNSAAANFGSLCLIGHDLVPGASSQFVISASTITLPSTRTFIAGNSFTSSGGNLSSGTFVGNGITISDASTGRNTGVGDGVSLVTDATYGTAGGYMTAVGYLAKAGAFRGTAFGSHTQALGVSSTVMGFGGYANKSHSTVFGRGGYNDVQNSTLIYSDVIYVGGVGAAWTNPAMPGTEVVNNSTSQNNSTYITRIYGRSGRDANTTPTLSDVRGGHLRIIGGQSTGTAKGGHLQWATTPAGGSSNNTENSEVVAAEIDAEAYSAGTIETRFLLLDLSDGTVKRVSFGADDSGGTGYKVLRVAN